MSPCCAAHNNCSCCSSTKASRTDLLVSIIIKNKENCKEHGKQVLGQLQAVSNTYKRVGTELIGVLKSFVKEGN